MTIIDNGILYENFNAFLVHKEDELVSELGIEKWRVINMWKEQTSDNMNIWLPKTINEELIGQVIEVKELGKSGWTKYDEMAMNGIQIHFYKKIKKFGGLKSGSLH